MVRRRYPAAVSAGWYTFLVFDVIAFLVFLANLIFLHSDTALLIGWAFFGTGVLCGFIVYWVERALQKSAGG